MDPCSFVRVLVGNLLLKFPESSSSAPSLSRIHPSSNPNCFCKIKLKNFSDQISALPVVQNSQPDTDPDSRNPNPSSYSIPSLAACFSLSKTQIERASKKPTWKVLTLEVYSGDGGGSASCGLTAGKRLLGKFSLALDLKGAETKAYLAHNGWVALDASKGKCGSRPELHLSVKVEPDPRFVFHFGGEPECSPQVFQVQGNARQAVFTCKFGFRTSSDRTSVSSVSMSEPSTSRSCLLSLKSDKDQTSKERKGWSIIIHDLSGSPVAMASMVTPFVPSPGSNRVTRSSPGAWLILRPDGFTWKPWGRLEAWREPGFSDALGCKFERFHDSPSRSSATASSSVSMKKGGQFVIDTTSNVATPAISPQGSWDLGSASASGSRPGSRSGSGSGSDFGFLAQQQPGLSGQKGLVMSASVGGVGKGSRPEVEVGVQHVTCTEDAAAYVALAAAVDLSMDACRLFSHKLRKELRQESQQCVV